MSRTSSATQRRWITLIGLIVSLASLAYALSRIQWGDLLAAFGQANYWLLLPAFLVIFAISWVRAYRWRLLMYPDVHVPLSRMFNFVNIGYLYNNILPAKIGEVIRAYLAGREISGGLGKALSSLLIERLLDVLCTVVLLLILLPIVPLPDWVRTGGIVFGGIAIGGTLILLVMSRFGDRGVDWLWRWVGRIPLVGGPKVEELVRNLVDGFGVLLKWRIMPGVLVSSVLVWGGYALLNYIVLLAFADMMPSLAASTSALCASAFSMVLPSSPGAIGVFEAAVIEALAVFGYNRGAAGAYALVLHLYTNIVLILLGLISLAREGVRFSQLREQAQAADDSATPAPGA